MAHAKYIREKVRSMRVERQFTIDELAERLALANDTLLRARPEAWMSRMRGVWM
jgi:hypothetical protein